MLPQPNSILTRSRWPLTGRPRRGARTRGVARLSIEALEVRWLLNASPTAQALGNVEPNETIDQAQDLGTLNQQVEVSGSIGSGPAGAADVTWFHFNLTDSSRVDLQLSTPAGDHPFASVVSLFNNDPEDFGDPYDLDGHRLLAQVVANPSSGAADYSQDLGPGDYFVAISGAGNLDFSPVIAGSGYDGATGNYELTINSVDLGLSADGPTVLSSDPAAGADLDGSPLAIRLDMSDPLDPNTIVPGQTVQLFSGTEAMLGNGAAIPVALASVNYSSTADELQLFPLAPLAPGSYTIWLAGNLSMDQSVLADPNGLPLGEDAAHPAGADIVYSFQVDGIDGVAGATASDDTPSTARQLGDVAGAGLIQVPGAIGDDPSYNPNQAPDPTNPAPQFLPANQVDLYHFQISGPGRYAMLAEVFAGRIGSPLDPGISLYQLDQSDGQLVFLAGDNNTLNPTQGADGSIPLFTDAALSAGLTAGDYYLAVADGSNTPSPIEGQMPGSPGILDPNQPGSAQLGWSTGQYVLNLLVQAAPNPPQVLVSSPSSGQIFDQPPTQITVQFSEPINIQQLAFQAFETAAQATLPQIFVEAADGTRYYPRFLSYDRSTNLATFQMLDGLPNGAYALHLSGPGGLTDLGGNPIVGDDPSGDYVIPFQVQGPPREISGNMTDGYTIVSQVGGGFTQDLGVLFPNELQAGVTVSRGPDPGASAALPTTQDVYAIQLLQNQYYSFTLSGDALPAGAQVTVWNSSGQVIPLLTSSDGLVFFGPINAGTYTVAVGGWTGDQSASVSYQLTMDLVGQEDNAPPLVDGPTPLLQIHLDGLTSNTGAGLASGSGGDVSTGPVSVSPGPISVSFTQNEGIVSPTGLTSVNLAQSEAMGALSGLGSGPLGGVVIEGGPAASPIQVALGAPPAPISGGLVSLITLTQVFSWNREGEGIEGVTPVEPAVVEASAEREMIDQTQAFGEPGPFPLTAQPVLALTERATLGYDTEPVEVEAAIPDAETAGEPSASPALASVVSGPTWSNVGNWGPRLVITGAMVAAAFQGRRAIQDLKSKKRGHAGSSRPAGPISRRSSQRRPTVTWLPGGKDHASPHEQGRPAMPAGSSRLRNAR
jgi:methionine-rich copper-binding protein CopC